MSEGSRTQINEKSSVEETALSPGGDSQAPAQAKKTTIGRFRGRIADYAVLIALVAMILAFSLDMPERFATWPNAKNILIEQAIPGILALAVIIPLTVGEFDLSIGANLGFASVFSAYAASHGFPVVLIILLSVLIGMTIGLANATLVRIGLNAFIATLGVGTILSGGNLLITQGSLISVPSGDPLRAVAATEFLGLRLTVFYLLGLAVLLYYILEWTPIGRYLRATGFGRDAARLTGVPTNLWLGLAFVTAGGIAGLAGFLQTATIGSASPTVGPEFLLPAYAAAFLGATTIVRGFFNVWGTIVGVFLLAVGTTGLALAGTPPWIQPVFNGAALIIAVAFAVVVDRLRQPASS
jgi:ribose transport system permease protein